MAWEGADFAEILTRILLPHGEGRTVVCGPALSVGQKATDSLALLFYELATNAAKYGSLSIEQGAVEVKWEADEKDVRLEWREAGGPVTKPPEKQGYGVRLVNTATEQLGGKIEYDWRPDGLIARLRLPVASLRK
jgi:two-component sensor histidine kinase